MPSNPVILTDNQISRRYRVGTMLIGAAAVPALFFVVFLSIESYGEMTRTSVAGAIAIAALWVGSYLRNRYSTMPNDRCPYLLELIKNNAEAAHRFAAITNAGRPLIALEADAIIAASYADRWSKLLVNCQQNTGAALKIWNASWRQEGRRALPAIGASTIVMLITIAIDAFWHIADGNPAKMGGMVFLGPIALIVLVFIVLLSTLNVVDGIIRHCQATKKEQAELIDRHEQNTECGDLIERYLKGVQQAARPVFQNDIVVIRRLIDEHEQQAKAKQNTLACSRLYTAAS